MPSAIEWTDETWNPVTGCTRVSSGCDHCYMFALYPRLRAMGVTGYATTPEDVQLLPERLRTPLSWKKPRLVFVNSMADLFHQRVPFDFIFEAFSVMQEAAAKRGHVFQVLTKRPGRAVGWWKAYGEHFPDGWPPNVWIGTSVESLKYAPRLTVLARLPAPVRFVSAEPLLEPLKTHRVAGKRRVAVGDRRRREWGQARGRWTWTGLGTCAINRRRLACAVLSQAAWGRSEQARR